MKTLFLAALLCAAALPVRAQTAVPSAKAATPQFSCPCEQYGYTPLSEKGRLAQAYWSARHAAKVSGDISSLAVVFGYLARSPNALRQGEQAYDAALSKLARAREKAVSAGAVKVVGEDLREQKILFELKKGVDFAIRRD